MYKFSFNVVHLTMYSLINIAFAGKLKFISLIRVSLILFTNLGHIIKISTNRKEICYHYILELYFCIKYVNILKISESIYIYAI